ncbi:hypothetical protein DV735_g2617, partial [Chaetothyriales sp. CBS 134920]
MADQNKYTPPEGPPPSYPPPVVHHDAGPYYPSASPAPGPMNQVAYYAPQDAQQQQQLYGDGLQDRGAYVPPYPQGAPYPQPPYQQQPYYGNQPPMYYQQPQPQPQPVQGYFPDQGRPGSSESFCAAFLGLMACCCCLDILF